MTTSTLADGLLILLICWSIASVSCGFDSGELVLVLDSYAGELETFEGFSCLKGDCLALRALDADFKFYFTLLFIFV